MGFLLPGWDSSLCSWPVVAVFISRWLYSQPSCSRSIIMLQNAGETPSQGHRIACNLPHDTCVRVGRGNSNSSSLPRVGNVGSPGGEIWTCVYSILTMSWQVITIISPTLQIQGLRSRTVKRPPSREIRPPPSWEKEDWLPASKSLSNSTPCVLTPQPSDSKTGCEGVESMPRWQPFSSSPRMRKG